MSNNYWRGTWGSNGPNGRAAKRSREVIFPTGICFRAKFPSRKNGRTIHCNSLHEFNAMYLLEMSPLVASYAEQPETFFYADGAVTRKATPDILVILITGEMFYIEVKPSAKHTKPETRRKLDLIKAHLAEQGKPYLIWDELVLFRDPLVPNLKRIFHGIPPGFIDKSRFVDALLALEDQFPMSIHAARQSMERFGLTPQYAIFYGLLTCDLTQTITEQSVLSLNLDHKHVFFQISPELGF